MNDVKEIVTLSYDQTKRPMFYHYVAGKNKRGMTLAAIKVNTNRNASFVYFGCSIKSPEEQNFVKEKGREYALFRAKMYPYKVVQMLNDNDFKNIFYDEVNRIRRTFLKKNINAEKTWRKIDRQDSGLVSKHEIPDTVNAMLLS